MKDPTAPAREAISNLASGLLPSNSPLKQSIEASKAEAKAKELEAKAEAERVKAQEQRLKEEASMMSAGQPAQVPQVAQSEPTRQVASEEMPQQIPVSPLTQGMQQEAQAMQKLGKEESEALAATQSQLEAQQAEAEAQRKAAQERIDATIKEIEGTKIEPKSFWQGKSTGQKITAGIGLFLASLTPEGADSAIKIINNEIERDLEAQKANLNKKQNTLSALERKLGSVDAAEAAFRVKALGALDLQLKQKAAVAKGPLVKAKLMQAGEEIQRQSEAARQRLGLEVAKLNKEAMKERKLGAEEQKRLDSGRDALKGVVGMAEALRKGQNTFSLVGDNDFTIALRQFSENLGRMQSGGAISKEEEERFAAMAPTVMDSKQIQQKKLKQLEQMMRERISALGANPDEQVSGLKGITFKAK